MIYFLLFLIALLSLCLGKSIAVIIKLRDEAESYRLLWLAAMIAGDEEEMEEEEIKETL